MTDKIKNTKDYQDYERNFEVGHGFFFFLFIFLLALLLYFSGGK